MGASEARVLAELVEVLLPNVVKTVNILGEGIVGYMQYITACHFGAEHANLQKGVLVGLIVPAETEMALAHTFQRVGAAFLMMAPFVTPCEEEFVVYYFHLIGKPFAQTAFSADDSHGGFHPVHAGGGEDPG